jgi:hypothetical protein
MKNPPPLPLDQRILQLRAECEAVISEHVEKLAKQYEGRVPFASIRQDIEVRARGNPFVQAMYVLGKVDELQAAMREEALR